MTWQVFWVLLISAVYAEHFPGEITILPGGKFLVFIATVVLYFKVEASCTSSSSRG